MGFFATHSENASVVPVKGKPTDDLVHHLECRICPLNKARLEHPKMLPTGSDTPIIYIIGEAPGQTEDEEGIQFVGKSGDFLRPQIPRRLRDKIRWSNIIRCHPEDNRDPDRLEVEACRPSIIRDIEKTKPVAVFGMGAFALNWTDKPAGIEMWRGRRFPVKIGSHTCWWYAFQHPSFILHQKDNRSWKSEAEYAFEFDLKRAIAEVEAGLPKPVVHSPAFARRDITCVTGRSGKDLGYVLDFLEYAGNEAVVGVDYETQNLRPYNSDSLILTAAVSIPNETLSFAYEHSEAGWTDSQFEKLTKAWVRFLKSKAKKAVHQLSFEMEWSCVFFGKDLARSVPWEDTMTQAYVLDERSGEDRREGPMSLAFGTQQYWGINIKKLTQGLDKTNMKAEPLEKILPYNGIDAKYHRLNYEVQAKRIEEENLVGVYQEKLRQVPTVVLTQIKGVPVDQEENRKLAKEYNKKLEEIEARIKIIPEVKQFRKLVGEEFNPGSNQQIVVMLRDILKTREGQDEADPKQRNRGRDKWSANERVLNKIDHPIAKGILDYRKTTKLKSTYVEPCSPGAPNLFDGGVLHTNYGTTFTDTGRLQCVSGSTVLDTNLGSFDIADLDLLDKHKNVLIRTHTGKWQYINALIRKRPERMWRFQFDNGSYIDCTERHQLLSPSGWKFAGSYTIGEEAFTNKSISQRNGIRLTKTSFWKNITKYIGFGRTMFRGIFSFVQYHVTSYAGADRIFSQYYGKIQVLVPKFVWPGIKVRLFPKLLQGTHRKYAWEKGTFSDNKSGVAGSICQTRSICRSNRQVMRDEPSFGNTEFEAFWFGRAFNVAFSIYEALGFRFANNGIRCSGNSTVASFVQLSRRPFEIKRFVISSVLPSLRFGRSNKNSFSKGGWSISGEARSCELGEKFGRNASSSLVDRSENTPYQTVDIPKRGKVLLDCRLLFAGFTGSNRNRWGLPRRGGNRETGPIEGEAFVSEEGINISHIGFTGKEEYNKDSFKDFGITKLVSKTSLGVQTVWDISVPGDCSYVAQGLIHHNSEAPNLQNWPIRTKEGKKVRRQIRKKVVASFDMGQIDARLIACASRDKSYCTALWEDNDIHMEWAERIAYHHPAFVGGKKFLKDKDVMKAFRGNQVKNTWVFALFYGAALATTAMRFGVDESVLRPLYDKFWYQFADVKTWQEKLTNQFEEYGYVQLFDGQRRHAPLSHGMVINTPIQNGTNRVVMNAMNRLSETDIWALQANMQIHDDLTYCFDSEAEFEDSVERITDTMIDGSDFDWICVPLTVELKCGPTWADLEEIGSFSSHKRLNWPIRALEFQ